MNWIKTVEPAPWSIAGFELGPLLFGHCMLIERFELNHIGNEKALHYFLNICSRSYEDARQWITSSSSQTALRFSDFNRHRLEVLEYLKENLGLPPTMDSDGASESRGTPFLQGLRLTAITALNYSPHEINESRFGQLMWDSLSYRESTGQTRVIDDYLAKQFERLTELNAKV